MNIDIRTNIEDLILEIGYETIREIFEDEIKLEIQTSYDAGFGDGYEQGLKEATKWEI